MSFQQRNIYSIVLCGLLGLVVINTAFFYIAIPKVYAHGIPRLLLLTRIVSYLVLAGALVAGVILYGRVEDKLHIAIQRNDLCEPYINMYTSRVFIWCVFLALCLFFVPLSREGILSENTRKFLVVVVAYAYLFGVGMLITTIVLRSREEERITRAAFINFARELGADETTLQQFKRPVYGNQKIPGIWAEVQVVYKDRQFTLAAENVLGSAKRGCFRYFLISVSKASNLPGTQRDLFELLNPQARGFFAEMHRQLKRSWMYKEHEPQLLARENRLYCRVPLTSKTMVTHLQTAMDILLSIE